LRADGTWAVPAGGGGGGTPIGDAALITPLAGDNIPVDRAGTPSRYDATSLVWASALNESIDDRVAALLVAGANITLTYNDVANTHTIASTGGGGVLNNLTASVAPTINDDTGDGYAVGSLWLWAATGATSTSTQPSALINGVWIGNDSADANYQLMYNDGVGTATKIDLGANFVKNQAEGIYELTLFCKPTDTTIYYRAKRLDAAGEASGSVASDIPAITSFLCPHFYLNNGGTAATVTLDFYRYYLECDY
jgi:hypothetical protein